MNAEKRPLAWQENAYPKTRRIAKAVLGTFARITFRPRYEGLENIPASGPLVLVSNHRRLFDVMLLHLLLPQNVVWLAKREIFALPLVGEVVRRMGAIPVDRHTADIRSVKTVFEVLRSGGIVGLFPEGTRVRPEEQGKILPRPGVVSMLKRVKAPILPVLIEGSYRPFHILRIRFGCPFTMPSAKPESEEERIREETLLLRRIYELGCELPESLKDDY